MILEFFDASTRSGDERRQLLRDGARSGNSPEFMRYGRTYFDDPDTPGGYSNYAYDGRFAGAAKRMVEHYGLKKGDKVLYGKYSGTEVTIDDTEYLIVRESDILAIL